jgi:hypothetical protein
MNSSSVDYLLERDWDELSPSEQDEFWQEAIFLMPTWVRTKQISYKYLCRINNPIDIVPADTSGIKHQSHRKDFSVPLLNVLMIGAMVQLLTNCVPEQKVYKASIGEIVDIVYANEEGPNGPGTKTILHACTIEGAQNPQR